MFSKVLIANRSEIAVRIARACRGLGVTSVAVHSDPDAGALHVRAADEAMHLPGVAPAETYLNVDAVLAAAKEAGAEAIHPGYGFLSENADFAEAVAAAGFAWVGPPAAAIRALGDKIRARRIALEAGVPVVPGITEPIEDVGVIAEFGRAHGFPLAIKAAGGGGGRGLKVVRGEGEVAAAFDAARRESEAYFGSRDVYVERYLDAPKHLEVQILAPAPDRALWLGVRDCSFQRRHQKLIEETPPPLFEERAEEMGAAAVALSVASGYVNAGTVELLVDGTGNFYFLEVNARLQVEHTVTEEVYGVDLVECQLRIAAGEELRLHQEDIRPRGHAIECRINAEDASRGFMPTPGRITRFDVPGGPGVRLDAGYEVGDVVPDAYDSLLGKLITWGNDRDEARARMRRALEEMHVEGIATTIPAHLRLIDTPVFAAGRHTTRTLEDDGLLDALIEGEPAVAEVNPVLLVHGHAVALWNPAMARSATAAVQGGAAADLVAPMQGTIVKVLVGPGQEVDAGDPLVVLEAMKMETVIAASRPGAIARVNVAAGETVAAGEVLVVVE